MSAVEAIRELRERAEKAERERDRATHHYDALVKKMSEWVWRRCPGCGRRSKYHPDTPSGEFHSDGCPLEGLYSHTHQWWFERELERLAAADRELAEAQAAARAFAASAQDLVREVDKFFDPQIRVGAAWPATRRLAAVLAEYPGWLLSEAAREYEA